MTQNELEKLLNSDKPKIIGKEIWIWGTGNTAQLYQRGFKRLEEEKCFVIAGYCDNNSEKWGKLFNKKPIISPMDLKTRKNVVVCICSPNQQMIKAVQSQLKQMRLEYYHIDEVILKAHEKEIMEVYDLLEDTSSKDCYAEIISCRINGKLPKEEMVSTNQYLGIPEFLHRNPKEVLVDCGGYVGDTIETYMWKKGGVFQKIISFEPDKNNFEAMLCRVERLEREWNLKKETIQLFDYGLGKENSTAFLKYDKIQNGLGSVFAENNDTEESTVKIIALDNFLKESYTFLKADIESYEYDMLLGAKEGIKKNKPLIAICIYHNAVDLYSIALLLHNFVSEYHFKIRHHSIDLDETVLYAYIE